MLPILETVAILKLVAVVERFNLFDLHTVVPRIEESRLRPAVILHVTLAADERSHLLPRAVAIGIVRCLPIAGTPSLNGRNVRHRLLSLGQRTDSKNEAWTRYAQLHRIRAVAIHASYRMGSIDMLKRLHCSLHDGIR